MNKIFLILLLSISLSAVAQNSLLKTTDQKVLRVNLIEKSEQGIKYNTGRGTLTVLLNRDQIEFIDTEKEGVFYYSYKKEEHDINTPELQKIAAENPESLMRKGGKVYIPITSDNYKNVLGRFNMRNELTHNYDLWTVVDTEAEAEFILEYIFEESGRDRSYFFLKTRSGKEFYRSKEISSEGSVIPTKESAASVQRLCKKEIKRIIKEQQERQ